MPIHSFLEDGVFGPEATAAMGEAFESACKELHLTNKSNALCTLIATLIVAAARRGELNPVRLRTAAMAAFVLVKSHPDVSAPNIKAAS
jgi:hypothetical protein